MWLEIALKELVEAQVKLPEPIFYAIRVKKKWAATILILTMNNVKKAIGAELALWNWEKKAIALYTGAAKYALPQGIIICDLIWDWFR